MSYNRIEQLKLPLQHRCKHCGRPIKHEGYGEVCLHKIVAKIESNLSQEEIAAYKQHIKRKC